MIKPKAEDKKIYETMEKHFKDILEEYITKESEKESEIQRLLDVIGDKKEDVDKLLVICKKRGKEIDKLNNTINELEEENYSLKDKIKELEEKLKLAEQLSNINMNLKIENYQLKDKISQINRELIKLNMNNKNKNDVITETIIENKEKLTQEEFTSIYFHIYKEAFKYDDETLEVFEDLKQYPKNKINRVK